MEFNEVIKNRYSCKKFDGKPVSQAQLDSILRAAQAAPTAKNLQEHHIYIIRNDEGFRKIDKCTPCRYGAATVAVVAYNRDNVYTYPGEKRSSGTEDATIVATHMMLAATNAGVDSCWINRLDPDMLKAELGLPENEEILMMLDLGFAAPDTSPLPNHTSRKPLTETITYLE